MRRRLAYWLFSIAGRLLPEPEYTRLLRVLATGDPEEYAPVDRVVLRPAQEDRHLWYCAECGIVSLPHFCPVATQEAE